MVAWATHQLLCVQVADQSWFSKFGQFRDFLAFHKPPFVILPEDDTE